MKPQEMVQSYQDGHEVGRKMAREVSEVERLAEVGRARREIARYGMDPKAIWWIGYRDGLREEQA